METEELNDNMTYNIERFVKAQENVYDTALQEIRNGMKQSHWIWFIFPQLRGLGHSHNSVYYGIENLEEARQYLDNTILKAHMDEILDVLLKLPTDSPEEIFGSLDARKLLSSMTLFDRVLPNNIFAEVIERYFKGKRDNWTLSKLNKNKNPIYLTKS